ncbi:hypothetical protein ACRRTK_005185 [Alexandromys fortis]
MWKAAGQVHSLLLVKGISSQQMETITENHNQSKHRVAEPRPDGNIFKSTPTSKAQRILWKGQKDF